MRVRTGGGVPGTGRDEQACQAGGAGQIDGAGAGLCCRRRSGGIDGGMWGQVIQCRAGAADTVGGRSDRASKECEPGKPSGQPGGG
ncbi:MAG: hypothetical protein CSA58_00390 [Micrococcales bacterium]|nr:MAG: hypothetical protein CSB46_02085 [Micrococcales bacterium]PIE28185.1 MAG: hypothetical protein CSA58_00390 [Micrococcales bacterium]